MNNKETAISTRILSLDYEEVLYVNKKRRIKSDKVNDSIYNNIAFGKTDATPQQVEAAARIANAHNFILEKDL